MLVSISMNTNLVMNPINFTGEPEKKKKIETKSVEQIHQ